MPVDISAGCLLSIDVRLTQKARTLIIENSDGRGFIKRHDVYAILCRRIKLDKDDIKIILQVLETEGVLTQNFQGIKLTAEAQHE